MKTDTDYFLAIGLGLLSTMCLAMIQIVTKMCLNKAEAQKIFTERVATCVPYAVFGIGLGLVGFILWALALRKVEVIQIYWVTAFAYVIIPALSCIFLRERVSPGLLVGYGLITIGAAIASAAK